MNHRINIDYEISKDYTGLNNPTFLPVMKIYNLIFLPIFDNKIYNIKISDNIKILDKTINSIIKQKVVFSTGNIELDSNKYFYFYIANGIQNIDHEYSLIVNNENIDLATNLTEYSAKLLIGSLILPDNYSYMFDTNIALLANIDNNYTKFNINAITNKYNFYQALTNNTILFILDANNFEILSRINTLNHTILIRPLYYKDFPLGSLSVNISNYSGVSNNGISEFKVFVNNKSYYINSNSLNIKNLASNTYTIKIIDRSGLLNIDYLNGQPFNKDEFSISIPLVKDNYKLNKVALPIPRDYKSPIEGRSHLMINLNYNQQFELLGPNNLHKLYNTGYQSLYNIDSGNYIIKYNNTFKSFYIPPNEIFNIPS